MIMTIKRSWVLLPLIVLGLSCEKTIQFTPEQSDPKLVVDATIEERSFPVVYLTSSLDYFSKIDPAQLTGSFVRGAQITISNGSVTEPLKEYEQDLGGGYSIVYYTVDSSSPTVFRGKQGVSYTMVVRNADKEYSATTMIPEDGRTMDALTFERTVNEEDTTRVILYGMFTDPAGFGNYTRYYTNTNEDGYFPGLASVYDDQLIDGKKFRLPLDKGVDRNSDVDFDDISFFHRGDTVTVKFCNIDRGVYDFWRTMEFSYSSIGNPFSSPTKVLSNISNGALGCFAGYSVSYASIRIPE